MIVAGFGCRHGAPAEDFLAALDLAGRNGVTDIAIPHFRAKEPGMIAATEALALPVTIVDQAALEYACRRAETHSALALEHLGLSSVAESAALVVAGPDSCLTVTRVSFGSVTCAIAIGENFA